MPPPGFCQATEPRASEGVKKSVESVAQPLKGRQSNSPRRQPWEKQVGEKALAMATDLWGFIDDPDRTLRSVQNVLGVSYLARRA
jgi:hypothetical protein